MAKKKSHETFVSEVKNLFGDKFTVVGNYVNNRTKIEIRHNECGQTWMANASFLLRGHSCPYCNINSKKTHEQFTKEVFKVVGNEYTVLSKYDGNKAKVKMKHNTCGNIWEVTPAKFITKSGSTRCPICQRDMIDKNRMKTQKQFDKEVKHATNGEYVFIEAYKGTDTNIKVQHKECGYIWSVRPASLLWGNRCPKCNKSKGEQAIADYLEKHNIKYKEQFSFKDCRGKRKPLLFDFALFDKDKIIGLIEYDGKQHFEPVDFFGGMPGFKVRVKYDKVKNDYCKNRNIPLTRIPYWAIDDIEGYVEDKLNLYNKPLQLSIY